MKKRRMNRIPAVVSISVLLAAWSSFVRPEVATAQACFYCDDVWHAETGYWHQDFSLFINTWHGSSYHYSWVPGSCTNWHDNYAGGGGPCGELGCPE